MPEPLQAMTGDRVFTCTYASASDPAADITSLLSLNAPADRLEDIAGASSCFTFNRVWVGEPETNMDFRLYGKDGRVYRHAFERKKVSGTEWKYNAGFFCPGLLLRAGGAHGGITDTV